MKAKRVSREEQLKLIMECRSSGLSDYQWCEAHGIHSGTFYNWVSKLRKAGVTLPDSESKHLGTPVHQEVVKVDLVPNSVRHQSWNVLNISQLLMPVLNARIQKNLSSSKTTVFLHY